MLAPGRSLDALRAELRPVLKARLAHAMPALARHGMRGFDVESLPRTVDLGGGSGSRGFPALVVNATQPEPGSARPRVSRP
jgi:hypothetical protein